MSCIILDAHIPPSLATWIRERFGLECYSLKYLQMREASDEVIFGEGKKEMQLLLPRMLIS